MVPNLGNVSRLVAWRGVARNQPRQHRTLPFLSKHRHVIREAELAEMDVVHPG